MPKLKLGQLAALLEARLEGDPEVEIADVAPLGESEPGDLSFVANPKYIAQVQGCRASALIVSQDLQLDFRPLLRTDNPYLAFTQAIHIFHPTPTPPPPGIHPTAKVGQDCRLGERVCIQAYVHIGNKVSIGEGTVLYPGVNIGDGASIGEDCLIYPRVAIGPGVRIGHRAILHSGSVIGNQPGPRGVTVEIGDDVELGANLVVESGLNQPTRIGRGTKVDNLVFIGAEANIAEKCIIVAQVGLGEGAELEEQVTLAGQVAVGPGLKIGARATVAARSRVTTDLAAGQTYSGDPAQLHELEKRSKVYQHRLPGLFQRVEELEARLESSAGEEGKE